MRKYYIKSIFFYILSISALFVFEYRAFSQTKILVSVGQEIITNYDLLERKKILKLMSSISGNDYVEFSDQDALISLQGELIFLQSDISKSIDDWDVKKFINDWEKSYSFKKGYLFSEFIKYDINLKSMLNFFKAQYIKQAISYINPDEFTKEDLNAISLINIPQNTEVRYIKVNQEGYDLINGTFSDLSENQQSSLSTMDLYMQSPTCLSECYIPVEYNVTDPQYIDKMKSIFLNNNYMKEMLKISQTLKNSTKITYLK